jgi:hypothetical protein
MFRAKALSTYSLQRFSGIYNSSPTVITMQHKLRFSSIVLFVTLLYATGCLKDEEVESGRIGVSPDRGTKIVEFQGPVDGLVTSALDASAKDTTITAVTVRLAAESVADKDIQVTLALNPAVIEDYNLVHGTSLELLPADLYSVSSLTVTIPRGERMGSLKITAKPDDLTGVSYALGWSIASVSDPSVKISGNYGKQVIAIIVKNAYEGDYHATGYFAHPTLPREIDQDKYLYTVDGNNSYMELGDLTTTYVKLSVNPGNTVDISAGPGTSGTTAEVAELAGDPVYNNTYDPVTRTFKLKYGYPAASPTRIITETVTRQ